MSLRRVIRSALWFAVGVLIAAVPMLASAQTPINNFGGCGWHALTATAAREQCISEKLQMANTNNWSYVIYEEPHSQPDYFYPYWHFKGCYSNQYVSGDYCVTECPPGQEADLETGQCENICPPDRTWNGTTCESPCQAKAGNSYGTNQNWATLEVATMPSGSTNFCAGTCEVKGGKVECESYSSTGATGDRVELGTMCSVQGPFTYTGNGCGPEGASPAIVGVDEEIPPWWDTGKDSKDCRASGGYWGQVNGDDVCVRPQPGENIQKETSTGNGPPSVESITNSDGTSTTKTTNTTTNCKDGSCTTTTTTTTTNTNADGTPAPGGGTEVKTETQPINDFCKANPTDPSCVGQTSNGAFSGTCEGGFKCTGDAVQCAIAEASWADRCMSAQMETENDFSTLYVDAVAQSGQPPTAIPEEDLSNVFTESSYVGGGVSCPSDISFSAFGRSITAPLGWLCSYLGIIALMLKTMAWLFVIRLIVTGV